MNSNENIYDKDKKTQKDDEENRGRPLN